MAPRKEQHAHDVEADTSEQIYQVARMQADQEIAKLREEIESIRQESFTMGAIKAFDANIAQNEFLKIMALYRIKQAKDYKAGGLTWAEFCDAVGVPVRTIDLMITEAKPLLESFSANAAELCGMPLNKIRMLGKAVSANSAEIKDNCLIYGDESIPLTPEYRDDIQALIERIGEEAREKVEEAEATLSAKDKVLKSKEDLLNKQERELKKYEKDALKKGLTPQEDAYLQQMDALRITFDGYMLQLEPDYQADLAAQDGGTPRMQAAYLSTLGYLHQQLSIAHQRAQDLFGTDEDGWQPPVKG